MAERLQGSPRCERRRPPRVVIATARERVETGRFHLHEPNLRTPWRLRIPKRRRVTRWARLAAWHHSLRTRPMEHRGRLRVGGQHQERVPPRRSTRLDREVELGILNRVARFPTCAARPTTATVPARKMATRTTSQASCGAFQASQTNRIPTASIPATTPAKVHHSAGVQYASPKATAPMRRGRSKAGSHPATGSHPMSQAAIVAMAIPPVAAPISIHRLTGLHRPAGHGRPPHAPGQVPCPTRPARRRITRTPSTGPRRALRAVATGLHPRSAPERAPETRVARVPLILLRARLSQPARLRGRGPRKG